MSYIEKNRDQIFADIIHRLESHAIDAEEIIPATRYPEFEEKILRPMCQDFDQYNAAIKLLADSRASSNIEEDYASQVEDIIRSELVELGINPEEHSAFITTPVLKAWIEPEIDDIGSPVQAVRNYAKAGLLPRIDKRMKKKYHEGRRPSGVLWLAADGNQKLEPQYGTPNAAFIVFRRNRKVEAEIITKKG